MKTVTRAIVAAGLALAIAAPAMASEVQRLNNKDGLNVTYRTNSERYCMTTHSEVAAKRFGLQLHTTECRTQKDWARQGLTLARHADSAQQVASVE
jgi:hypothetical protein